MNLVVLSLVSALVATLGMTTPASVNEVAQARSARPTQVIALTDTAGEPTDLGEAALDSVDIGQGSGLKALPKGRIWKASDGFDPSVNAQILTDPLAVDPFMVTGLTWDGDAAAADGSQLYIRVRENGEWSNWFLLKADGSAGRDDGVGRAGTDPFVTSGADGVQVLLAGDGELPAQLALELVPGNPVGREELDSADVDVTAASPTQLDPDSAENASDAGVSALLSSIDSGASGEDTPLNDEDPQGITEGDEVPAPQTNGAGAAAGSMAVGRSIASVLPAATTMNGLPVAVVTRSEWGGPTSGVSWRPSYESAPFVVVHHTAGTNNYSCTQSASIVKGIYSYHADSLQWGDIGYNFLVDKCGNAFEGRFGTLSSPKGSMVVAGHSAGFNSGTMGISILGEYTSVVPTNATLNTVGKLAGWQLQRAGVAVNSTGTYISEGNSKYPAGTKVKLPRISGHRDNGYTACPGDAVYARMNLIREAAGGVTVESSTPGSAKVLTGTGTWVLESGAWKWRMNDGNYVADLWGEVKGQIYYFGPDSLMHEGWLLYDNVWYYLRPSGGELVTGRVTLSDGTYDLGATGAMQTGWVKYDEGWRYYENTGRQSIGWKLLGNTWYYLDAKTGLMATGWFGEGGVKYYFDPQSGAMATGWKTVDKKRYYFNPSTGALATGWVTISGAKYYLKPSTGEAATGWLTLDGKKYYMDAATGALQTGWVALGNQWFYTDTTSGEMATGWVSVTGVKYYFDPQSGAMATGWKTVDKKRYYFNPSTGALQTGWIALGNQWFYTDTTSGEMATGWASVKGVKYYLAPDTGAMKTGWLKLNGDWYYLTPGSGALKTGWLRDGGAWYYLNTSNGKMVTGWLRVSGTWYYMEKSGAMKTGWLLEGKTWYYLNSSGAMVTGWHLINGTWYFFEGSGAMR